MKPIIKSMSQIIVLFIFIGNINQTVINYQIDAEFG